MWLRTYDSIRKNYQSKQKQNSISQKVKKKFHYSPSQEAQKCYTKNPLKYSKSGYNQNQYQNIHIKKSLNKTNQEFRNVKKVNDIQCQYSSVKQQNTDYDKNYHRNNQIYIQSNNQQYGFSNQDDTSSWIAKLVNGIQQEDQKNIQKISQIQNRSINDLPQDSNYLSNEDEKNQFLFIENNEQLLFSDKISHINKNKQKIKITELQKSLNQKIKIQNIKAEKNQQKYHNRKQMEIKDIRSVVIPIYLKQIKEGLKVPPGTRANSLSKRQNYQDRISSKKNSSTMKNKQSQQSQNDIFQKQSKHKTKERNKQQFFNHKKSKKKSLPLKIRQKRKSQIGQQNQIKLPDKDRKSILTKKINKNKSETKIINRKIKQKDNEQQLKKVQSVNTTLMTECKDKTYCKDKKIKDRFSLKQIQNRNQQQLKYQNEIQNYPTRKNSYNQHKMLLKNSISSQLYIQKKLQDQNITKQYKIVKQHSKYLKIQNLFTQTNEDKQNVLFQLNNPQNQKPLVLNENKKEQIQINNKKIGGIKRNIYKQIDNKTNKLIGKLNQHQEQQRQQQKTLFARKDTIKNIQDIRNKYNNLNILNQQQQQPDIEINKINQPKSINYNYKNVFNDKNKQRQQVMLKQCQKYSIKKKYESDKVVVILNKHKQQNNNIKLEVYQFQNQQQNDMNKQILNLFQKAKLDPSKELLTKNNLKLRGLNDDQKTLMGSIITKIHYKQVEFNYQMFKNQFKKINTQCSKKGCLSKQKHQNIKEKQNFKNYIIKNKEQSIKKQLIQNKNENLSSQKRNINKIQNQQQILSHEISHKRRDSQIIKRKLFQQIQKISQLQQKAQNQLEKNSRTSLGDNRKQSRNLIVTQKYSCKIRNICKDPYIEGSSLMDINISKIRPNLFKQDKILNEQKYFKNDLNNSPSKINNNDAYVQNKNIKIQLMKNISQNNSNDHPLNLNLHDLPNSLQNTCLIENLNKKLSNYIDKNQLLNTYRQFNLNFSLLKQHIR